jgi:hypothetical protein
MRRFAKLALKLVTAAGSVFIAACYGIPFEGTRGTVVDSGTGAGIPGIDVGCIDGTGQIDSDTANEYGQFNMAATCTELVATDVDGAANGSYVGKTVPVTGDPTIIKLDPQP